MSQKHRLPALLLALFFGSLGVHRFYVGKVRTGLTMLLTCLLTYGGYRIGVEILANLTSTAEAILPAISLFVISLGSCLVIWVLVDIIMILVGAFTDKEGRKVTQWKSDQVKSDQVKSDQVIGKVLWQKFRIHKYKGKIEHVSAGTRHGFQIIYNFIVIGGSRVRVVAVSDELKPYFELAIHKDEEVEMAIFAKQGRGRNASTIKLPDGEIMQGHSIHGVVAIKFPDGEIIRDSSGFRAIKAMRHFYVACVFVFLLSGLFESETFTAVIGILCTVAIVGIAHVQFKMRRLFKQSVNALD